MSRKFTRVLIKKLLGSRQRWLGKTAVIKAGACIVSNCLRTESGKISFFEKRIQAVHSNACTYFTGLPVSSSLYRHYSSSGLHMIQSELPVTRWCNNNLSLAGKRPVQIKLPLTQIQYLCNVPGFRSACHICNCHLETFN